MRYVVGIAIGVYSATRQYGIGDCLATVFGFLGLSTPPFLAALVLVYLVVILEVNVVGFFLFDLSLMLIDPRIRDGMSRWLSRHLHRRRPLRAGLPVAARAP